MPVETLSGVPHRFTAGDTVRFSISDGTYPASAWTLTFAMRGLGGNLSVAGTVDGDDFTVTLTAAQTAALAPGTYTASLIFTETASSEKVSKQWPSYITVHPDMTLTTVGPRRQAYEAARTKLESLTTATFQSVSLNGQSFTRGNSSDLRAIVDRLLVEALEEDRLYGLSTQGGLVRIVTRM